MTKRLLISGVLSILFIGIGVILVLRPAPLPFVAIGSANEIGVLIGGIAAVIVGLLNAMLLYVTLQNQITKDEREAIESQFSRIEKMIQNFSFKKYVEEPGVTGAEALSQVVHETSRDEASQFMIIGEETFDYLWLILLEIETFEKRLDNSRVEPSEAKILERRLILLYTALLARPFTHIAGSKMMRKRHPDFLARVQSMNSRVDSMLTELGSPPRRRAVSLYDDSEDN